MMSSFSNECLSTQCWIAKQQDICEVWFKATIKEQMSQNHAIVLLTAWEGCIHVLQAVVVLNIERIKNIFNNSV